MKKVFCSGTFDILHRGHMEFLKDAKKQGDYLIVFVVSDKSVYENKKKNPINKQKKRAEAVEELEIGDEVVAVSDDLEKNIELLFKIKPDVFVVGYDQKSSAINKLKKILSEKGVKIYVSKEYSGGIHASDLI